VSADEPENGEEDLELCTAAQHVREKQGRKAWTLAALGHPMITYRTVIEESI
jgi:hypothetical protein